MSVDVFHQKNGKRSTFTKHWPAWSKRITGLAGKYYFGFLKNIFLKLGMRSLCAMAHRGAEITKNLKKHVLEEDSGPPTPPGRSREANRPQKRCQNHNNEAQREPNGPQNHQKSHINYPLQPHTGAGVSQTCELTMGVCCRWIPLCGIDRFHFLGKVPFV